MYVTVCNGSATRLSNLEARGTARDVVGTLLVRAAVTANVAAAGAWTSWNTAGQLRQGWRGRRAHQSMPAYGVLRESIVPSSAKTEPVWKARGWSAAGVVARP